MMRRILLMAIALLALGAGDVLAQSMLETNDQARQRQSAERWQQYEEHGRQAPLGGYQERLGELAQPGGEYPGYRSVPQSYGQQRNDPYGSQNDQQW